MAMVKQSKYLGGAKRFEIKIKPLNLKTLRRRSLSYRNEQEAVKLENYEKKKECPLIPSVLPVFKVEKRSREKISLFKEIMP